MIKTPFGNIKILIDGKEFEYQEKEIVYKLPIIDENPLDGTYRILVPVNNNKSVCCIIDCEEILKGDIETGERFFSLEFTKGKTLMSIGAEDESDLFETLKRPNGIEYKINSNIKDVEFGIAWTLNVLPDDIRTWFASDPTMESIKDKN